MCIRYCIFLLCENIKNCKLETLEFTRIVQPLNYFYTHIYLLIILKLYECYTHKQYFDRIKKNLPFENYRYSSILLVQPLIMYYKQTYKHIFLSSVRQNVFFSPKRLFFYHRSTLIELSSMLSKTGIPFVIKHNIYIICSKYTYLYFKYITSESYNCIFFRH